MTAEIEAEWVKRMTPFVWREANRRSSFLKMDVEDLIAEANLAVVLAVRSFKPTHGAALSTWIMHGVKWRFGNLANRRTVETTELEDWQHPIAEPHDIEREERRAILRERLVELKPEEASALFNWVGHDIPQRDLACLTGRTRQAVSQRVHKGLKKLRRRYGVPEGKP